MSDAPHKDHWIEVRPILTDELRNRVTEAQVADDKNIFVPQYALTKGQAIIGACRIMDIPVMINWFNRKTENPINTMRGIHEIMNLIRCQGRGSVMWHATNPDFEAFMPKLGFEKLTDFYGREL